jgi:hypothetical protein
LRKVTRAELAKLLKTEPGVFRWLGPNHKPDLTSMELRSIVAAVERTCP